jgi:hypothetical protein
LVGRHADGRLTQVNGSGQTCHLASVGDLQSVQGLGGVGDFLLDPEVVIEIGDERF